MDPFMVLGELAAKDWTTRVARSALPDAPIQPLRRRQLGRRTRGIKPKPPRQTA
jgi:hypothetical protein